MPLKIPPPQMLSKSSAELMEKKIFGQKTTPPQKKKKKKTEGNLSPITVFSRWYTKPLSSEFLLQSTLPKSNPLGLKK